MSENRPARGIEQVSPEQDLARREPAFPGLGVLVDPELFTGLLRLHARSDPGPGRLVGLRYQPGSVCLATYIFGEGPGAIWVYARALDPHGVDRVRGGAPAAEDASLLSAPELGFGRLAWDDYGLTVRAFPYDDRLPALAEIMDPELRGPILAPLVDGIAAEDPNVRTVSYEPELRWTGCLEGARGPLAALRLYASDTFDGARWNADSLHAGERLTLPRYLGRSREHCGVAIEWMRGRPLEQALIDAELPRSEIEAVGAALAELHGQAPEGLSHHTPASGAVAVRILTNTMAFILPRCGPRVRRLGDRLVRRLVDLAPEERPIHGNLRPNKVLLQGGGCIVLLDLDHACQGAVGRDAGTLIAHLERAVVGGQLDRERADWATEAFLEGYDRTATWPLRRRDVRMHTALGLFGLALDPFRTLMPEWPDKMVAILEQAERTLAR